MTRGPQHGNVLAERQQIVNAGFHVRAGTADTAFRAFYKALKPGGILGVEEHRGRPDQPQDPEAKSGYVRQDYAIALAEKAGLREAPSDNRGAVAIPVGICLARSPA